MKKILTFILTGTVLWGCEPSEVVESTYEDGSPKVIKYYDKIDGKKQVVKETILYENSRKKMEGTYLNERRNGNWRAWYNDGKLWSEGEYKDGKRHGPGTVYHPNGRKYIESFYTEDEKTGKWRFYDTAGTVIKEVDFEQIKKK